MLLSFKDYERLARVPSFGRLLMAFPGEAGDIPERIRKPARDIGL